jgi:hypothetical protein
VPCIYMELGSDKSVTVMIPVPSRLIDFMY